MENAAWKPISDVFGFYEVSSFGEIRSVDRNLTFTDGRVKFLKGKVLKAHIRGQYLRALASIDNKDYPITVHRAVAKAFCDNPENKPQVNHKDLNKLNNHYTNLEWCTPKENLIHAAHNGVLGTSLVGEKNPMCKLTDAQIDEIVYMHKNRKKLKIKVKDIATMFGIHKDTVLKYAKGIYRGYLSNGSTTNKH